MMIVSSLRLKKYFWVSFQHSMSSLTNILITFPSHPPWICGIPSPATETNPEPTQKVQNVDSTRFPEISSEEIEELKAVVINRNTSNSTEQWINIFKSWCQNIASKIEKCLVKRAVYTYL